MGLARRDDVRHTFGEYRRWPEDVRYELIDGVAYLMSPAPSLVHQDIAGEIYHQLAGALEEHPNCRPFIAPVDVRLPRADEADDDIDTVVQPDVLVVCELSRLDRRGVRGAPDFVVEILSQATATHDQQRKRNVYERAGVREYWLVHPVDRTLTIYRLAAGVFAKPEVCELSGETPIDVLPGVAIRWSRLVRRLDDWFGRAEST